MRRLAYASLALAALLVAVRAAYHVEVPLMLGALAVFFVAAGEVCK